MPTHTIAENLERLNDALEDIREAVYDKGGPPINFYLEGAAEAISQIPSGNCNTAWDPDKSYSAQMWYTYIETFAFPGFKYPEDDYEYGPSYIDSSVVMGLEDNKCPYLTTIKFPASVTEISSDTFSNRFTQLTTIIIDKPQDSISGAPWGAPNATVIWTG